MAPLPCEMKMRKDRLVGARTGPARTPKEQNSVLIGWEASRKETSRNFSKKEFSEKSVGVVGVKRKFVEMVVWW